MKTLKNDVTYLQTAIYAVSVELLLIVLQYVFVKVYNVANGASGFTFTNDYMNTTGFFIFFLAGFVIYIVLTYIVLRKSQKNAFNKMLILFIVGGLIEVLFYLTIEADYKGAFMYSVMDKFLALFIGVIFYEVSRSKNDVTSA